MNTNEAPTRERRRNPRFPVSSGLFAVDFQMGQIIDISMGGLAFRYVERRQRKPDGEGVGIIFDEEDLCFDRIPVQTVSDVILSHAGEDKTPTVRRCGVRFLDLSYTQKSLLQNFIWFNTNAQH
ncbi:MAG: hypothetical protein AUK28_06965 [Desulfobacterales bacterium CG2_30_60_27]|nr:MAG: hypothetical protein AUK28_06965 [Desulfobacterales bacterium CG2_30_60_27]